MSWVHGNTTKFGSMEILQSLGPKRTELKFGKEFDFECWFKFLMTFGVPYESN